jgi:hypothetical protein
MATRGKLALRRQLQRELQHKLWLERNLAGSAQLVRCEINIAALAQRLCITHKRKERAEARSFPSK